MTGNKHSRCDTVQKNNERQEKLVLIAEGLHILNQQVYEAISTQNRDGLLALARKHLNCGAQALAVNLGTGKKMAELTPWVVNTLLDLLDIPLFLSANILDHPELLHRYERRITVNAVTADPDTLPRGLDSARQFGTGLVVLLVKPGLTPSGIDDRLALTADVLDQAYKNGLAPGQLYLDPVLSCRPDPHALRISRGLPDVGVVAESIVLIKELSPDVRTIVGLGTDTQTLSGVRRNHMQGSIGSLLIEAGLDAVIMNCQDSEQVQNIRAEIDTSSSGELNKLERDISRAA